MRMGMQHTFHCRILRVAIYYHGAQVRLQLNHRTTVRYKGTVIDRVIDHGAVLAWYQCSCIWGKLFNRSRIHLVVIFVLRLN